MPLTRKSSGARGARPGLGKAQSTLSFSGRVTKSTVRDGKKSIISTAITNLPQKVQSTDDDDDDDDDDDVKEEEDEDQDSQLSIHTQTPPPERTEDEIRAENVSHAQIASYWTAVEHQRKAPRVHQEGVEMCEKVLRYFDVSSQYGPCIGITRRNRWLRAHRLGLNPPIEVLAVLVKEEEAKGCKAMETAKIDGILNSIAVET